MYGMLCYTQGLQEARLSLRDWLVLLALAYHRAVHEQLTPAQLTKVPVSMLSLPCHSWYFQYLQGLYDIL